MVQALHRRNRGFFPKPARLFGHHAGVAFPLLAIMVVLGSASFALLVQTADLRFSRDLARLTLEDRLEVLESARLRVAFSEEMLRRAQSALEPAPGRPYLVISIEDRRLWLKQAGEVLFTAEVAVGSGKTMVKEDGASEWKFDTPRGRLEVRGKEQDPVWVPPDWYYLEQSQMRNLGLARLEPGRELSVSDGSIITVDGNDVVREYPDGRESVLAASDGRELVVDGELLVPPPGTKQRRYQGVLGDFRLNLGHGYSIHGTNRPDSVGRAVSHGCVRLRNEDIAELFSLVEVGTPVYIY